MSTSAEKINQLIGGYTDLKSYFEDYRNDLEEGKKAKFSPSLDGIKDSGFYRFNHDAIGSPRPEWDGRLIHIEEPNGEASQVAILGTDAIYFRDRDRPDSDPEQAWGGWVSVYQPTVAKNLGDGDQAFDPAWMLAPNLFGDTEIEVGDYIFRFVRSGDLVHLSGNLEMSGFSKDIPTDDPWSLAVDIGAVAQELGIFSAIRNSPHFAATVQFYGGNADTALVPVNTFVRNKDHSLANSLNFRGGQTDTGGVGGATTLTADRGVIRFSGMLLVTD
ncbi:MAG: hypothetical protein CR993_00945 [Rhodobacterales bacterium]|nr:MAG: hypothetical protein CR993_00945 [Rhodobacterales bacterium]